MAEVRLLDSACALMAGLNSVKVPRSSQSLPEGRVLCPLRQLWPRQAFRGLPLLREESYHQNERCTRRVPCRVPLRGIRGPIRAESARESVGAQAVEESPSAAPLAEVVACPVYPDERSDFQEMLARTHPAAVTPGGESNSRIVGLEDEPWSCVNPVTVPHKPQDGSSRGPALHTMPEEDSAAASPTTVAANYEPFFCGTSKYKRLIPDKLADPASVESFSLNLVLEQQRQKAANLEKQAAAGTDRRRPPVVAPEQYDVVKQVALAGGMLDLIRLEEDRLLRVWTPPGFSTAEAGLSGYPVLYLNDGQNLFDPKSSISGSCWCAAETAASLITSGQLPPFVIVGIDHAGVMRSWDYTPCLPGTGPKGFRKDAAKWPGGGVDWYLEGVVREIVPFITKRYATAKDPSLVAFGGSSFGGICALRCAMKYRHVFGSVLVESPSLWIGNEGFLKNELLPFLDMEEAVWPERTFVGMGTKEYSGIRAREKGEEEFDSLLAGYVPTVVAALEKRGAEVKWEVENGATHSEKAWAGRLPAALKYLCTPWWKVAMEKYGNSLFFTSPRKLKAGKPAVLYVNKNKSEPLAGSGRIRLVCGFNNWTLATLELEMQRAPHLPAAEGVDWWQVEMEVPVDAYEMNLVLADGEGLWDNNAGYNFYIRVQMSRSRLLAEGTNIDELARQHSKDLFFFSPPKLMAGKPAEVFVNRKRSWPLANSPNLRLRSGFNNWEVGNMDTDLKPTTLWRDQDTEWWSMQLDVPDEADELNFCLSDGHGVWDNNDGHNFNAPVQARPSAKDAARFGSVTNTTGREIASIESVPHAEGMLHVLNLERRKGTEKSRSRWTDEKRVRVWTPPGYSLDKTPPGGWPVLFLNDGQNMFECWLAHQGVSWRVGYTASDLIRSGELPPFLVCAVDSIGALRSHNYLPYAPGTGVGGFRGDCERWPGGGLDAYLHRLVTEILPLVRERFGTSDDPAKVAFGGGSFAGITALQVAMKYPHVFGSVLAESPSLWVTEGRFLQDMAAHRGMLPERIFIGCGTKEYSATRDHDRPDVDDLLLHYYCEAARLLEEGGMRGDRLRFLIEEGAGHHELAWQWRLMGALQFLLSPWWDA